MNRSSLTRLSGVSPISAEELEKMRRDAWLKAGFVCLKPDEIGDAWTRRVVINEAERRYGKREDRPTK